MKKIVCITVALAAIFAVSCEKNELSTADEQTPAVRIEGVPMTLNANLGDVSRTAYELDGNVLKATWSPGDSVSVVAFNSDSQTATVRSIDNFALRSGEGTSDAVFEGYFTGGDAERIVVYYPCVNPTQTDKDTDLPDPSGFHGSPLLNGEYSTAGSRAISELKVGSPYVHFNNGNYVYIPSSGDLSNVHKWGALYGYASITEKDPYTHTLDVSFQNLYSVIKLTAVFPSSLSTSDIITNIQISTDAGASFGPFNNWGYAADPAYVLTKNRDYIDAYFGSVKTGLGTSNGINLPADRTIVCYLLASIKDQPAGTKWTVTANDSLGEKYTRTITLKNDSAYEPGKMYRLTVNLQGTSSPAPPSATNLSPDNHTSNCYVIASDNPGTYKFKNCKGESYNYLNGGSRSAVVLWEAGADPTVAPSVGDIVASAAIYDDGYVYITTTGARGNAVVAVKDASDNILWSWHIWCTGAGFDPTADVAFDGSRTWMKANLGAFSYATDQAHEWAARHEVMGLLYQYGRKDPFRGISELDLTPYTSAVTGAQPHQNQPVKTTNSASWNYVACDAEKGTVAYANAHPMTFINPNEFNNNVVVNDWVYTEGSTMAASDRWGDMTGNSTDNPCPYGWRVPSGTDLGRLITDYSAYNPNSWAVWPNLGIISNVNGMGLLLPACGSIRSNGQPLMESLIYDNAAGDPDKKVWKVIGYYWSTSGTASLRRFLMAEPKYQITNYEGAAELWTDDVRIEDTEYALSNGMFWPMGLATAMSVRCVK